MNASRTRPAMLEKRRPPRRRGQALVEFALIVPLLLLLILGIVEFGRAWNAYQVVTDAAREGARVAVVNSQKSPEEVEDTVVMVIGAALARGGFDPATATIELYGGGGGQGTPLQVYVELPYTFAFLAPLMKWTTGQAHISLKTSFVMRNE